jgi:hypothetical protein
LVGEDEEEEELSLFDDPLSPEDDELSLLDDEEPSDDDDDELSDEDWAAFSRLRLRVP